MQGAQALVAVEHQIAPSWLGLHDDDRHLLTVRVQGGQQPALLLRPTGAKILIAQIQLMELQLHARSFPTDRPSCGPAAVAHKVYRFRASLGSYQTL
jgi:hypothetical protein